MNYQKPYQLLAALDISECNGNFERMLNERMQALCNIKSCALEDLTLRETIGCIEAAQLDFNEMSPAIFNGHTPRPVSDITRDHLGALA